MTREFRTVVDGMSFTECPRWHQGRLVKDAGEQTGHAPNAVRVAARPAAAPPWKP